MSQKDSKFQSKGKKFGGKPPGKFGGGKKPAGRGFGKSFDGDKGSRGGSRSFGDKPERSYSDRKPRSYGDDKPRSSYGRDGDRKPRAFGDKPAFKKRFDDDKPRSYSRDGDRKPRAFGDKPAFKKRFDDDKPRSYSRDGDRNPRAFGDKPAFKKRFDDDKPRSFDRGDKPRSFDRDGPRKPPRGKMDGTDRAFAAAREKGGHVDEPAFARSPRKEKPFRSREEGDRKPYQRSFDDNKRGGKFQKRERSFDRAERSVPRSFEEASPETRQKLKSERSSFGAPSSAFIFGTHPVSAAINNPTRLMQRLLVTEKGFENIAEAYSEAVAAGIKVPEPTYVEREDIERLLPRDAVHQEVLLDSQPPEETFLADLIIKAPDNAKIVILDQVTDPHNVGAIMRSAIAFGAIGVVAQKLHAPEITGTLAKSASGAAEHIPLVREVNLSRAIEQLKDAGFTVLGLDERGKTTIAGFFTKGKIKTSDKIALVMGAEGDGLRRLVAENCDALVKLPTDGPIASLNVSNAAAVALYELARNND